MQLQNDLARARQTQLMRQHTFTIQGNLAFSLFTPAEHHPRRLSVNYTIQDVGSRGCI